MDIYCNKYPLDEYVKWFLIWAYSLLRKPIPSKSATKCQQSIHFMRYVFIYTTPCPVFPSGHFELSWQYRKAKDLQQPAHQGGYQQVLDEQSEGHCYWRGSGNLLFSQTQTCQRRQSSSFKPNQPVFFFEEEHLSCRRRNSEIHHPTTAAAATAASSIGWIPNARLQGTADDENTTVHTFC